MAKSTNDGEYVVIFTPDVRKEDVISWFRINNKKGPSACFVADRKVRVYLSDVQTIVELRLCWGDSIDKLIKTYGWDF
jgi:hypothetical protein